MCVVENWKAKAEMLMAGRMVLVEEDGERNVMESFHDLCL